MAIFFFFLRLPSSRLMRLFRINLHVPRLVIARLAVSCVLPLCVPSFSCVSWRHPSPVQTRASLGNDFPHSDHFHVYISPSPVVKLCHFHDSVTIDDRRAMFTKYPLQHYKYNLSQHLNSFKLMVQAFLRSKPSI